MSFGKWGVLTVTFLVLLGIDGYWIANANDGTNLRVQWLSTLILLVGLCVAAGYLVNTRIDGILIDDRNRISLERMQWSTWLIVLFSGYFVEAVWNTSHGGNFPSMQKELLALLGIISGSPVLSNLIVDTKKRGTVTVGAKSQVSQQLAEGDTPARMGLMDANNESNEASWADLYLGEEVANRYVVDVSRLQKVVITVLLVLTYAGWLWHDFEKPPVAGFSDMPPVGETFVWLVGLSHASYLASKATPKTPA